jgi:geranylgeranylglycerol-phosphate geranylgeranyltransferase
MPDTSAPPSDTTGLHRPFAGTAAAFQLMRPFNCLMSAVAVWLGVLAVGVEVPWSTVIYALACGALITAGGNTINDCFDAEIDRVNHPSRPIPSGRIRPSTAWAWAIAELALGLILGLAINKTCGVIAATAVALLLAYEAAGLKNAGLPGNITISLLTGLLFITGGAAAGDMYPPMSLALLAFLASLGREIIKDIEDMAGDTTRETWPMRVGAHRARQGAAALLAVSVLLSPLPWLLGTLSMGYFLVVLLADAMFIRTIVVLFTREKGAASGAKQAMFIVLAAFLIGVLT